MDTKNNLEKEFRKLHNLLLEVKSQINRETSPIPEIYLDNPDLMKMLKVSVRTLENWRQSGLLPFSRIGTKIYYKLSDIDSLFQSNYIQNRTANQFEKRI